VIAAYPADGQGTNAAPDADVTCTDPTPECPVPTNVRLELRFDRFLLPGGGIGSGVALYTGNPPANGIGMNARYDVIERVVVLEPGRPLQPNTLYTVEIVPGADSSRGFWAYDLGRLEEGELPLTYSFMTGSGPAPVPPARPESSETCDSMPSLAFAGCVSCHTTQPGAETQPPSKYPPMGLDLSTPQGLFYTAIGRVAHQAETGNDGAGEGLRTPVRFGVQMNVIDPGRPATSYLMYKLLQKPANYALAPTEASCDTGYHPPVSAASCAPPDDAEVERLREWFLRGEPMPKNRVDPETGEPNLAATNHANLRRIADWITAGANCHLR
jgi:hypothetical protein